MGCHSSKPDSRSSAIVSPEKHKKSRFCRCEVPDGSDSFICLNCNLIKERARDKATKMLPKSHREKTKIKLEVEHAIEKVDNEDGGSSSGSDSSENEDEDGKNNIMNHIKEVINYKIYQEMAFAKVFQDFDADSHNYISSQEFRQMCLEYEDGSEIYQPVTVEESDMFIDSIDDSGDKLLDCSQFTKKMILFLYKDDSEMALLLGGGTRMHQIALKVTQFARSVTRRLDCRAAFLYTLFTDYATSHYSKSRDKWIPNVLNTDRVFTMMCEMAQNGRKKPSEEDVLEFMRGVDKNGDMLLQEEEFLSFMLDKLTDSKEKLQQYMRKSKMNNRVAYFLRSVDNHVKSMDSLTPLDDVSMEVVMMQIQDALRADQASREGRRASRKRSSSYEADLPAVLDNSRGSTEEIVFDTLANVAESPEELNDLIVAEQVKRNFRADVEGRSKEKDFVRLTQGNHTEKKMDERSQSRMTRLFKPKTLERAANFTSDEMTRAALLRIVTEELRTNGMSRTPEQSAALEDLLLASENSIGVRRVRLSGSERNLTRMKEEFVEDQRRFIQEAEAVRSKQKAKMKEKLIRRRASLQAKAISAHEEKRSVEATASESRPTIISKHSLFSFPSVTGQSEETKAPIRSSGNPNDPVEDGQRDFRIVF